MGTLSQRHSPNRNQFSALAVTIEMDACNASHSLFTDFIHRIWDDLVICPQCRFDFASSICKGQICLAYASTGRTGTSLATKKDHVLSVMYSSLLSDLETQRFDMVCMHAAVAAVI